MKFMRLLTGVLLWVLVLVVTSLVVSTGVLSEIMERWAWLSAGTVSQFSMLAASLLLILGLSRGRLGDYGFRPATGREVRLALIYGSAVAVAVHVVLAVVWRLIPPSSGHPELAGASFLRIVITVWVIASICEEIFLRGLVQSFLDPLKEIGTTVFGIRFSLPVVTGAVLFGAMHIMLLTLGTGGALVGGIVGSAIALGMVAGYFRERSGSLLPAIVIHMLFNIYGSVSHYIQQGLMG